MTFHAYLYIWTFSKYPIIGMFMTNLLSFIQFLIKKKKKFSDKNKYNVCECMSMLWCISPRSVYLWNLVLPFITFFIHNHGSNFMNEVERWYILLVSSCILIYTFWVLVLMLLIIHIWLKIEFIIHLLFEIYLCIHVSMWFCFLFQDSLIGIILGALLPFWLMR